MNKGEHGGLEGRTEGGLTFYLSSRGRDFRHTQVGGGHDVIVGKAVPTAGKRRGPDQGKGLADHSPPRRKWTLLGAPVFMLDVILRPGNPRGKEPGKKVLLRRELARLIDHQHPILQPGCLRGHLQVEREEARGRRQAGEREAARGARPPDPGRARLQELKKYPDHGENRVTRKNLSPRLWS